MSEEIIVLDRFEYKLPKDFFVVYKRSKGFKYKLKYSNKEFDSELKLKDFIESLLKERTRYKELLKTLSVSELSKLFSLEVLLNLTPSKIKEYTTVEEFEYVLVVDDRWESSESFNSLQDVKSVVADRLGLNFHYDYTLCSEEAEII